MNTSISVFVIAGSGGAGGVYITDYASGKENGVIGGGGGNGSSFTSGAFGGYSGTTFTGSGGGSTSGGVGAVLSSGNGNRRR